MKLNQYTTNGDFNMKEQETNELMSFDNEKQAEPKIEEKKIKPEVETEGNKKKEQEVPSKVTVKDEKPKKAKSNKADKKKETKQKSKTTVVSREEPAAGIKLNNESKEEAEVSSSGATDHMVINTAKKVEGAKLSGNGISTNTWN